MATYVQNPHDLFVIVVSRRITEFPSTGTVVTIEPIEPAGTMTPGLHRTATFVTSGSDAHRIVINVHAGSADDIYLREAAEIFRKQGKLLPISVKHMQIKFASANCGATARAPRNFNADATEMVAHTFEGTFETPVFGPIILPPVATPEDFA